MLAVMAKKSFPSVNIALRVILCARRGNALKAKTDAVSAVESNMVQRDVQRFHPRATMGEYSRQLAPPCLVKITMIYVYVVAATQTMPAQLFD